MSTWMNPQRAMASPFSFINSRPRLHLLLILLAAAFAFCLLLMPGLLSPAAAGERSRGPRSFPLEMDSLMAALTNIPDIPTQGPDPFPRTVRYRYIEYDIAGDSLREETRSVTLSRRPKRIIPQAIGITEILWAIAPHQRIVTVHESCKNPKFSFIAGLIPDGMPTFGTADAEIVIGSRPDLVLTTYYSDENFLHQLRRAGMPMVQLGFFDDLDSIQEQILLIGRLIGEEPAARRLTAVMDEKIRTIRSFAEARRGEKPLKVLYYDNMGYVAGRNSTFDSLCQLLGVVNVASANGVRYFKQVDYETLLKWDPDMIIVPEESSFDQQLYSEKILASAKAVKNRNIRRIPSVYLLSASQYLVASANYMAGLLYE
ncbi:MAG: ABC transporter substrate-binding protein [Syntrophotaleaceae bacterium]